MSISTTPVQEKASNAWSSGTSFTITGISSPTNGNCLVIYFDGAATTGNVSSITQTGATWTNLVLSNTNRRAEIWYALNVSGAGTTITINLGYTPASSGTQSAEFSEWSGIDTSGAAGPTNTGTGGAGSTAITTNSVTPVRECLMIGATRSGAAVSAGPTGGFTALTSADAGVRGYGAYQVTASPSGSYTAGWTQGSGTFEAVIGTLYAPAAAGGTWGPLLGLENNRLVRAA